MGVSDSVDSAVDSASRSVFPLCGHEGRSGGREFLLAAHSVPASELSGESDSSSPCLPECRYFHSL